jgi:hypothetical protein
MVPISFITVRRGVSTDILAEGAVVAADSASVDPLKALPAQGVQKPAR